MAHSKETITAHNSHMVDGHHYQDILDAAASQGAPAPRINPTSKHWEVFNGATLTWTDTGIIAEGYTPTKGVDYFDGAKGDPGYTPVKGVDYFDGAKGDQGDPGYTPIKGTDYFDGAKGDKGDPGYTPIKGIDYFDGAKGDPGTGNNWYFGTVSPTTTEGMAEGDVYLNQLTYQLYKVVSGSWSYLGVIRGNDGLGVPLGGTTGQVLSKKTDTDNDTQWVEQSGGITLEQALNGVYPVGSVYLSMVATNPATLLGIGTWAAIAQGRALFGVDPNDTDFNAAGKTAGSKTHTLATAEMPVHAHTFTGSSVNTGNNNVGHTHSISITSGGNSADHSHAINITSGQSGSHYHELVWNDGGGSGLKYATLSTSKPVPDGSHPAIGASVSGYNMGYSSATVWRNSMIAELAGTHSHAVTGNTGNNSVDHTHLVSGTSGGISANHLHAVTAAGTISNTGSGNAFSILNPSFALYVWQRTA
jgi:hypothetical protein